MLMTNIYDILLNFNDELIEYFEWDDSDKIKYIKKIALFKISSKDLRQIIKNDVVFSDDFIKKVPKYEMNGFSDSLSVCLFTDGLFVIGVMLKKNKISLFSRMLCDEEKEVLEISDSLDVVDIDYEVLDARNMSLNYLTRKERKIRDELKSWIDKIYFEKRFEKLFYLYYEYFDKESKNVREVYNSLKNSLDKFNYKHVYLYDILLLSNTNSNK